MASYSPPPTVRRTAAGGDDRFRIRIWDKNNADAVVYDNKPGAADDSYDGTALGGGSIVLHKNGNALTATVGGDASAAALLTQQTLDAAVVEAIAGWDAAGIKRGRLARLANIDFDIAQFAGATLGLSSSSTNKIWLDLDAAGLGWSTVSGGYDLVSAVSHELGHSLGFDHGVLGERLEPGEVHHATQHFADHHGGSHTLARSPGFARSWGHDLQRMDPFEDQDSAKHSIFGELGETGQLRLYSIINGKAR